MPPAVGCPVENQQLADHFVRFYLWPRWLIRSATFAYAWALITNLSFVDSYFGLTPHTNQHSAAANVQCQFQFSVFSLQLNNFIIYHSLVHVSCAIFSAPFPTLSLSLSVFGFDGWWRVLNAIWKRWHQTDKLARSRVLPHKTYEMMHYMKIIIATVAGPEHAHCTVDIGWCIDAVGAYCTRCVCSSAFAVTCEKNPLTINQVAFSDRSLARASSAYTHIAHEQIRIIQREVFVVCDEVRITQFHYRNCIIYLL